MERLNWEKVKYILESRFANDSFSSLKDLPHPYVFKDMEKGASLVKECINKQQKILIVGDYDVDGTLASVIMMRFFALLGYKNVTYYIPNRFSDGYGVSVEIIKRHESDLIITVDNGISAIDVGEYCFEKQKKLIITDHHAVQDRIPRADALINPQQENCDFPQDSICGAAVAWYFCNAIKIALKKDISLAFLLKYVAIATIADMMPLVELNRIFVKKGLEIFEKSELLEDVLLKTLLKSPLITAQDVAFYITPLLNSAGRIKDAGLVCEFFLAKDEQETHEKFTLLKELNQERKDLAQKITLELEHHLVENDFCVVAYHKDWNEGILGILAAKLANVKNKPAFVFRLKDGILKGSGRSNGLIDIFQTLLPDNDKFIHFGGHSEAVGISIALEFLESFLDIFTKRQIYKEEKESEVLGELLLIDINKRLLDVVRSFEPYGQGNPVPQFLIKDAKIYKSKTLKDLHQKFELENQVQAIEFFSEDFYKQNDRIDFYCTLQEEHYKKTPMLVIKKILCHL
nr:single-stranded-DNA-specific exonuclease RecJ [Helicobacter anatolicus]